MKLHVQSLMTQRGFIRIVTETAFSMLTRTETVTHY